MQMICTCCLNFLNKIMRFLPYDSLRLFDVVALHESITAAADKLNLTKGAVSYQINRLEDALGFKVFDRVHRGITLTEKGRKLWHISQSAFDDLERQIAQLQEEEPSRITIGMSTYFASRWLSPRLMTFMADHPRVRLRLQPLVDLSDLKTEPVDMAIRWGKGHWTDVEIEPLFLCPAMVTAGATLAARIDTEGLSSVLPDLTLLDDRDGSEAWADWHRAAKIGFHTGLDRLVIPDPNVRVQAVIDGQGIALNDTLVGTEVAAGTLFRISPVELDDYGYFLAYPRGALANPSLLAFRDWILGQAAEMNVNAPIATGTGTTDPY